jgi:hypothetical protein
MSNASGQRAAVIPRQQIRVLCCCCCCCQTLKITTRNLASDPAHVRARNELAESPAIAGKLSLRPARKRTAATTLMLSQCMCASGARSGSPGSFSTGTSPGHTSSPGNGGRRVNPISAKCSQPRSPVFRACHQSPDRTLSQTRCGSSTARRRKRWQLRAVFRCAGVARQPGQHKGNDAALRTGRPGVARQPGQHTAVFSLPSGVAPRCTPR